MRRRNILIVLCPVLVGVAGYLFYSNSNKATAASPAGQFVTVTRGNLIATVVSAGPVASESQVALSFGMAGTVKQVYVKLDDQVKQGQVLAELEGTDLQFALTNAQLAFNQQQIKFDQITAGPSTSDLATAQLNVDTAQASYDVAVRKAGVNDQQLLVYRTTLDKSALALQKAQSDYNVAVSNHVTDLTLLSSALQQAKLDYTAAQANYNIQVTTIDDSAVRSAASTVSAAKAALLTLQGTPTLQNLAAAQNALDQAKLSLQQAQYNMRNAQLTAPADGVVTALNLVSGMAPATAAIQLTDLSKLQVTVNIAEVDVTRIQVSQDVSVTFDALIDNAPLAGKVSQIARVGTTTSGVVNYPVVIKLPNLDSSVIKVGMTANVGIVVDQRQGVLLVPNSAINTQGKLKIVQVQTATDFAPRVVTIGLQNDTQSEVLSGLNEGEAVLIGTTTTTPTGAAPGGLPGVILGGGGNQGN